MSSLYRSVSTIVDCEFKKAASVVFQRSNRLEEAHGPWEVTAPTGSKKLVVRGRPIQQVGRSTVRGDRSERSDKTGRIDELTAPLAQVKPPTGVINNAVPASVERSLIEAGDLEVTDSSGIEIVSGTAVAEIVHTDDSSSDDDLDDLCASLV